LRRIKTRNDIKMATQLQTSFLERIQKYHPSGGQPGCNTGRRDR